MSSNRSALLLTSDAEQEIIDAFLWYEQQRQGLGLRFEKEVFEAFDRISQNPFLNRKVSFEKRRAIVKNFPYGVYYQVNGDQIIVLAVVSFLRDPSHWKKK